MTTGNDRALSAESTNSGVVIVGGAAGSKVVYDVFSARSQRVVGFIDNYVKPHEWHDFAPTLLGTSDDPANQALLCKPEVDYFVATGDNLERAKVTRNLLDLTGKLPVNAIHPTATISPLARVGAGNLINAGAIINAFARIGNGTIINTGAIIEHDNDIDDYAQISPGVVLAGYVTVETFAFVGVGACVIPHMTIGAKAIVGGGAAVVRHVEPSTLVVGVPATVKRHL